MLEQRTAGTRSTDAITRGGSASRLVKAGALQDAILTSANFSIIATHGNGIIQLFNVGAERMPGCRADEVEGGFFNCITEPIKVVALMEALDEALLLSHGDKAPVESSC